MTIDNVEVVIDILDRLWDAEISEKSRPKTEEYASAMKELDEMEAELKEILNPEEHEKVEQYIDKMCEINYMEYKEAFKTGVSLAVSIVCQSLMRAGDQNLKED